MAKTINLKPIGVNPITGAEITKEDIQFNDDALKTAINEVDDDLIAHETSSSAHGSDDIVNESAISGATVSDALTNSVNVATAHIASLTAHGSDSITNESTVTGTKVSDALENVEANINNHKSSISAHSSSSLTNSSTVSGTKISDALNTLKNDIDSHIASLIAHASENITVNSTNPSITADNVLTALEDLQTEIGLIIASSGTSDTEVVNARLSSIYGAFTVLKDRLDASDVLLDGATFSTFSDIPITESVQAIPSTQVDSASSIEAELFSAVNSVVNGDAVSSVNNVGVTRCITKADGTWLLTGTYSASYKTLSQEIGDEIFLYAKVKDTSIGLLDGRVSLLYSDASSDDVGLTTPATGLETYGTITCTKNLRPNIVFITSTTLGQIDRDYELVINKTALGLTALTEQQMLDLARAGYFEAIKDYDEIITSTGKNLLDINNPDYLAEDFFVSDINGEVNFAVGTNSYIIPVAEGFEYSFKKTGGDRNIWAFLPDNNLFDGKPALSDGTGFVTGIAPIGTKYLLYYVSNVGTALPKEGTIIRDNVEPLIHLDYKSTSIRLTGAGVPIIGDTLKVKNVESYVLKASDITNIVTSGTNVDYAKIPITSLVSAKGFTNNVTGQIILEGKPEIIVNDFDNLSSIGSCFVNDSSPDVIGVIYAKGTLLAEAQADLAGTEIRYQLATPIERTEYDNEVMPIYTSGQISTDGYLPKSLTFTEVADNKSAQGDNNVDGIAKLYNKVNYPESQFSDLSITESVQAIPSTQIDSASSVEATFESLGNLADNGIDYVNHVISGAGTTKGADGIHLVADGAIDKDTLAMDLLPSTEYTVIYEVSDTNLDGDLVSDDSSAFGFLVVPKTIGINKVSLTTLASPTTNDLVLSARSNNTDTTYIDYKILAILEGDRTDLDLTEELDFGIKDYDEIITSTNENVFDEIMENGSIDTSTGEDVASSTHIRTQNFITVEPNTQYSISSNGLPRTVSMIYYDSGGNYISTATVSTFTTPLNCKKIRFRYTGVLGVDDLTMMVKKGLSALPYVKSSHVTIRLTGASVPVIGDTLKVENVESDYRLKDSDIEQYTETTNIAFIRINHTNLNNLKTQDNNINGSFTIKGFNTEVAIGFDDVSNIGKFATDSTKIYLIVEKLTYTDVDDARNDLVNVKKTNLNYQLATPIPRTNSQVLPIHPLGQVFTDGYLPLSLWLRQKADNKSGQGGANVKAIGDLQNQATGIDAKKADIIQEDWIEPTLFNGWLNTGPSATRYYKDNMGVVHIDGNIIGGTAILGTVIFTLPQGYIPSNSRVLIGERTNDATVTAFLADTNGNVIIRNNTGSGTFVFNGLFRVD